MTPCVGTGRVFVGGGFGSFEFYAFDQWTGDLLWGRRTRDDGPTAAILAKDRVLFNTESCTLTVLRADTGAVLWEHWLGDPLLAQPAVADGLVFMAFPNRRTKKHTLAAFRLSDGKPVWMTPLEMDVITAPVVEGGTLYLSTWDGCVACYDAATGAEHWRKPMRATSAPWVRRGEVFISHRDDATGEEPRENLSRVTRDVEEKLRRSSRAAYLHSKRLTPLGRSEQREDAQVGFATNPAAAKLDRVERLAGHTSVSGAWRHQGSRPTVWEGRVYSIIGDQLSCTQLPGREKLWTWDGHVDGHGERALSPPAVVNGRVYAGTRDGRVLSWDAQTGAVRWAIRVGETAVTQPAVWHGRIFVGLRSGDLVSFATGDLTDHGWSMWGGGPGHNA